MVKRHTSNKEFEKLKEEIHRVIGNKFKGHRDGDYEKLLLKSNDDITGKS